MDRNTKVGVIGAGTMGTGIAQVAATAGHTVVVQDTDAAARERSRTSLDAVFKRLVAKRRVEASQVKSILQRITWTGDLGELAPSGLVIEAIIEDLPAKQGVFEAIEGVVPASCVLATNTSSLSIAAVSSTCRAPGRVLGLHFFNPVPLLPLVEVIPGINTRDEVTRAARDLVDGWGKTTVFAKDTPGFIVNRVARPFYGEALRILDEGIADVATIDWAMKELGGFRMGPFELMDLIGNDVNYAVTETVFQAFFCDPRYKPSFTQKRLVEANLLGRKTQRGFYDYREGARDLRPKTDRALGQEILGRILAMLINEAADALFWRIASKDDIDLAMTKGVNYPKGLFQWGEEIGPDRVLADIQLLREEYGEERYRPSPLLKRVVREGGGF